MSDSEYADDTGLEFCSREDVEKYAPLVNDHFRKFGMEVHEKRLNDTKVKTMVLMCAATPSEYADPVTMDDADLSDIVLPNGNVIPVVCEARYLGSMMSRDSKDDVDVQSRIDKASSAFGSLRRCIFSSRDVDLPAKREVYVAMVLSILLYGSESWCLTQKLWNQLRSFHHRCVRAMCGINMWHVEHCRITTAQCLQLSQLRSIETYVVRRQLQWAGHVARMEEHRLPRRFLTAWCYQARPAGGQEFTYGKGLEFALRYAKVDVATWMEVAQDRPAWKGIIRNIAEPAAKQAPHHTLLQLAMPRAEARARYQQEQQQQQQQQQQRQQRQPPPQPPSARAQRSLRRAGAVADAADEARDARCDANYWLERKQIQAEVKAAEDARQAAIAAGRAELAAGQYRQQPQQPQQLQLQQRPALRPITQNQYQHQPAQARAPLSAADKAACFSTLPVKNK